MPTDFELGKAIGELIAIIDSIERHGVREDLVKEMFVLNKKLKNLSGVV
jgi:hypothetical protein